MQPDCFNQKPNVPVVSHITQQYKTVDNKKLETLKVFPEISA